MWRRSQLGRERVASCFDLEQCVMLSLNACICYTFGTHIHERTIQNFGEVRKQSFCKHFSKFRFGFKLLNVKIPPNNIKYEALNESFEN